MHLDEAQLRAVPDGGVLYTLPNGIQIIRRKKHEGHGLGNLSRAEIEWQTNKMNGAKFLPEIDLRRIVEMTAEALLENGAELGANTPYNKLYRTPIGISKGEPVRVLRVRRAGNGRFAHAYPEDEGLAL
jgi:hypothetical protein